MGSFWEGYMRQQERKNVSGAVAVQNEEMKNNHHKKDKASHNTAHDWSSAVAGKLQPDL